MVSRAITKAVNPAKRKVQTFKWMRYEKLFSHSFMKYQATGHAMRLAMMTQTVNDFESIKTILLMLAPRVFRTPISFTFCWAMKMASPKRPRQAITTARMVNTTGWTEDFLQPCKKFAGNHL